MRTRPLARLSAVLLVGLLASAGPTRGAEVNDSSRPGAELPHAPHRDGEYHNLDPEFRRVSGWIHTRFYLLSFAALVTGERHFAALPTAVPDVTALRNNHHAATVTWIGHSTLLVQLDGVNILFALEEEFKIDIPDAVAQNMKSVAQVVDGLTRVLEGKDISDLVAIAKSGSPAASH